MKHDQHPQFLREVLVAVERTAREIAGIAAAAVRSGAACISDKPGGSPGYDHVCTLLNGATVSIRRVNPRQQSEGLQLEIRRSDGTTLRVPRQAPYIPWSPSDADLAPIADGLGRYVLALLAGVDEVGPAESVSE